MLICCCDYCGTIRNAVFKIPSSAFYVQNHFLVVHKKGDYINICKACLTRETDKETRQS